MKFLVALSTAVLVSAGASAGTFSGRLLYDYPLPHVYTVSAFEFVPEEDDVTMRSSVIGRHPVSPRASSGSIWGPVHLPDGAQVIGVEMEYCRDEGASGVLFMELQEFCEPGTTCYVDQGSGVLISEDAVGCGKTGRSTLRPPVDNAKKLYYAKAQFTSSDASIKLIAYRIYYRVAKPPRPVKPTFSDVTPDDPFYPFIEALVSSGVTVGCGDGKFCPDAAVTRAQVAVFLTGLLAMPHAY